MHLDASKNIFLCMIHFCSHNCYVFLSGHVQSLKWSAVMNCFAEVIARLQLVWAPAYEMQKCLMLHLFKQIQIYYKYLKCHMMSPCSYHLEELDLSSCLLTHDMLQVLWPAFRHTYNLKWVTLSNSSVVVCNEEMRITKKTLLLLLECIFPCIHFASKQSGCVSSQR